MKGDHDGRNQKNRRLRCRHGKRLLSAVRTLPRKRAAMQTGTVIVTTTLPNTTLSVINPADNPAALGITPLAGGTQPVSAHLTILLLA